MKKKIIKKYIDVGTPELLSTCLHSSGVSFPSLFLSALLNILRTYENNKLLLEERIILTFIAVEERQNTFSFS